jgi:hypothetical protein
VSSAPNLLTVLTSFLVFVPYICTLLPLVTANVSACVPVALMSGMVIDVMPALCGEGSNIEFLKDDQ